MNAEQLAEAQAKNKNWVCAYPHCQNPLTDPPLYGPMGLSICQDCDTKATQIVADLKETPLQSWTRMLQAMADMGDKPKPAEEEEKKDE